MKTLQILKNEVNALLNETSFFIVNSKEDNYENNGDANYSESKSFKTLEEAFDYYNSLEISIFETESEYKEIELILNDDNDIFEVLENESYIAQYSKEDYGKFVLHYLPKNNGVSVSKIEVIDSKTHFYVNEDKRFSMKSGIFDTKEEVIEKIYQLSLYISKEEAEEMYNINLQ